MAALNAKAAEFGGDESAEVAGETAGEVGAAVAEAVGEVAATVAAVVAHEVSAAHEDAHEAVMEAARVEVAAVEHHEAAAVELAAVQVAAAAVVEQLDKVDEDEAEEPPVAVPVVVADDLGHVDDPAEHDDAPADTGGAGHPWFRARRWGKAAL